MGSGISSCAAKKNNVNGGMMRNKNQPNKRMKKRGRGRMAQERNILDRNMPGRRRKRTSQER
jgi:hypothetical protein